MEEADVMIVLPDVSMLVLPIVIQCVKIHANTVVQRHAKKDVRALALEDVKKDAKKDVRIPVQEVAKKDVKKDARTPVLETAKKDVKTVVLADVQQDVILVAKIRLKIAAQILPVVVVVTIHVTHYVVDNAILHVAEVVAAIAKVLAMEHV